MASLGETYRRTIDDNLPSLEALLNPAIVVPGLLVTLSESLLYVGRLDLALWSHFLTLLICVFAPLYLGDEIMFQVFALVPVFRLVNLGMPTFLDLTIYWFPLVYAPLFPAIYVVARADGAPSIEVNPRTAGLALVPGVLLGAYLAEIEYGIIRPEALIPAWDLFNVAFLAVVMLCFVGLVEELVFRGLLQRALEERVGRWAGLLLASFVFGMMHSAYGTPVELVFAGAIGLIFGAIYDATDSILAVTVVHGVLNVFLFGVIPIHGSLVDILSGLL